MPHTDTVLVLFTCDLNSTTDTKICSALQRKTAASCQHKGITGFFLAHQHGFVALFEGKTNKVFSQIETLVRKDFVTGIDLIREIYPDHPCWPDWFQGGPHLSDLPPEQIERLPGLAQFIVHKLNAG